MAAREVASCGAQCIFALCMWFAVGMMTPGLHATARTTDVPWVNLRPPRVGAGMVADQVSRVFRRNQGAVRACYTPVLQSSPTARALITVRITVLAGGFAAVESLRVQPENDDIENCVRSALGRWQWPNPRNSPATEIRLQIDLAPTTPANARR